MDDAEDLLSHKMDDAEDLLGAFEDAFPEVAIPSLDIPMATSTMSASNNTSAQVMPVGGQLPVNSALNFAPAFEEVDISSLDVPMATSTMSASNNTPAQVMPVVGQLPPTSALNFAPAQGMAEAAPTAIHQDFADFFAGMQREMFAKMQREHEATALSLSPRGGAGQQAGQPAVPKAQNAARPECHAAVSAAPVIVSSSQPATPSDVSLDSRWDSPEREFAQPQSGKGNKQKPAATRKVKQKQNKQLKGTRKGVLQVRRITTEKMKNDKRVRKEQFITVCRGSLQRGRPAGPGGR
jgi:hypothetical protein